MVQISRRAARFTALSAIVGGLLAYANVGLSLAVTGSDTDMILHGATMLSLPADTRDLFRWSMLADVFGFYLPFLAIAGYFLRSFRDELGALGDMVLLAIGLYITVGIIGAVTQLAIIHPLAHVYAGGDDATRVAAATVWGGIANATQSGLWWIEGPLVLFWAMVACPLLKKAGWKGTFLLKLVGWTFGLLFIFGFFEGLDALTNICELIVVLVLPLWMLIFGGQVWRRSKTLAN